MVHWAWLIVVFLVGSGITGLATFFFFCFALAAGKEKEQHDA